MKLKILLVILMLIIGISPSFAQTTPTAVITGTATTIIGPGGTIYPVSLQAQLVGCQQQVPVVPGGSVVQTFYTQSAPSPTFTATITAYGNDIVSCGTQNYTTYAVTWLINNQPAAPTATYRIVQGATCNISNGTCKPINFIPAVISKGAGLFCPSGQILNGFNADYTPSCQAFTGSLIPPFLTNGVANTVQSSLNITGTNGVAASSSGATVTLDGSALTRSAPTSTQTITQPVNTNLNVVTSGSGQLQSNGQQVATVGQIPSITGLIKSAPTADQSIIQPAGTSLTVNAVCQTIGAYDARACGHAKGDATFPPSCTMLVSSATLTCPFNASVTPFAATDVGKEVYVAGAGAAGATLKTTIATFISTTQVSLTNISSTAVSGVQVIYGSDDTTALQNSYNIAAQLSRPLFIPYGNYIHHGLKFTQSNVHIYSDAKPILLALAVTNPGRINTISSVGVDLSGTGDNIFENIRVFGGFNGLFADMAPNVNFYAARIGGSGFDFAIKHTIRNVHFQTAGPYNVYLYGYEQASFIDNLYESFNSASLGNFYLAAQNTAGRSSPYFTIPAAPASMTKVSIFGGATTFAGAGKMVVMDQGGALGVYSISIRDAFVVMGGTNGSFISDTGGSPLKHIELMSDYMEMNACTSCVAVSLTAAAWDWNVSNLPIYNTVGAFTNATFTFAAGFLDSNMMIDSAGTTSTITLNATSCQGSVLHLGQAQASASTGCLNDAVIATGVGIGVTYNKGFTGKCPVGQTPDFTGGIVRTCSP